MYTYIYMDIFSIIYTCIYDRETCIYIYIHIRGRVCIHVYIHLVQMLVPFALEAQLGEWATYGAQ